MSTSELDAPGLLEVERLALGEALLRLDVEEHDLLRELPARDGRGELTTDVSGSDQRNFLAHGGSRSITGRGRHQGLTRPDFDAKASAP
jgi:hypothetical protein